MQNDLHITPLKGLLIVLAGTLLISIGIWHCSVPFGDEAGYISRAMGLVSKNEFTFNLYILTQVLQFRINLNLTWHRVE